MQYPNEQDGKMYWEILESYNEITRNLTTDKQLPVIDLAAKLPKSSDLFYDYIHYTNKGAEAVADIIVQDLANILKQK